MAAAANSGIAMQPVQNSEVVHLRRRIEQLENRWAERSNQELDQGKAVPAQNNGVYRPRPHAYIVANPAPLGLFAFGVTTALLQGSATAWTEPSTNDITWGFAIFFGGLVQLLAGQWELYRNNMFAGLAFSSYGGFWLGLGLYGTLAQAGTLRAFPPAGMQMMLALWGIFTFMLFVQTLVMNIALQMLFFFLSVTFFLLSAGETHPILHKVGGWFGVFVAAIAYYIAFAELTNECYRKKIMPLGNMTHRFALPENNEEREDII